MSDCETELFNISEPLVALCFGDLRVEVLGDFAQPSRLRGVDLEEVAADAGVFMDAGRAVGAVAVAERDLALPEVFDEFGPFGTVDLTVFPA